jgi:hypothetical protein
VRPVAHYVPELVGRGKQTARITVICEEDCVLPELAVVHGDGAHRPVRIGDGQVVHRIPGPPVRAGAPDVVEFPVGRLSGPAWLVCLALDQAAADADVIPLSLSRLKVR